MRYSKIEGNPNLRKDESTKAILNVNSSDYENYILMKRQKEKENLKIDKIENDVNSLKEDILEIKSLLRYLINEPK